MPQSLILAIDQGGQSSRVAVYSLLGEPLYCFSAACATTHVVVEGAEHIEQSPLDILTGIKDCLEKIKQVLGADANNIIAAGFAGQGSSLLCWDNLTGEALSPVLSWQDIRGEKYLAEVALTHQQAQQLTGLRVSPHYGASKMRWLLDNNLHLAHAKNNNSLSIGPIVSYIFWHMCGRSLVDPGHAQRTLLWNLPANQWDKSLLAVFNIPQTILPECKFHNSYFCDLPLGDQKIPFVASARDQGASLFARGLPDKNACYINIGTGAFIQRVSENLTAPDGLLVSPLWLPQPISQPLAIAVSSPTYYASELENILPEFAASAPQTLYAWEATVNGAASATSFIEQQTELLITPEEINYALQLAPEHECYFLNAVGGLSAPWWRTDLQSRFSENLSPHEKILAWLESIIFQITVNVRLMDQLGGVQKIYISGGMSKADAVCQKLADLLSVPVHRSENTDATLQGIACMAAGLPKTWKTDDAIEVFQPQENPPLVKAFCQWRSAMDHWLISKNSN
jgi:glycerol kinase